MSRYARSATRGEARAIEQAQDKLHGYPSRGTQADGSSHRRVPQSWDGAGRPPVGWTSYRESSEQDGSQFLTPIDRDTRAALDDGRAARLTAQERTTLGAAERNATERPAPDGGGTGSVRT